MPEAHPLTTVLTPAAAKKLMRGHMMQGRYAGADSDCELSAIVRANLKLIIGGALHPTSFFLVFQVALVFPRHSL